MPGMGGVNGNGYRYHEAGAYYAVAPSVSFGALPGCGEVVRGWGEREEYRRAVRKEDPGYEWMGGTWR